MLPCVTLMVFEWWAANLENPQGFRGPPSGGPPSSQGPPSLGGLIAEGALTEQQAAGFLKVFIWVEKEDRKKGFVCFYPKCRRRTIDTRDNAVNNI
ncbi:hypothetical protein Emed_000339 [Eimeria media]